MSILNEASMRIGDARGQLELERLRRDREERRAAMLAQGLQTITQGGLGALQTGAQFATDYQAQKQAKEQNAAMLAFKQQQAADRAARDAAKQRIEEAKLGMTQADFASQAKLRDAKAAGEASLVQERRAEALAKMTSAGKTPDEIAKMHAGELEGLDFSEAAKPTGEDQKALARAMFGKGELPQDTGRTVLDAKVDEIAQRYEQRAAAQERVLIANGFSPGEAQANVTRMGLRPDKAALKAALLREQESRQMAQQKGKLEMGTAFNKSASEGLSLLENQAYGLAAKAVSEGRELTADDVEAFTLQQGANEADAITALAKAYDAAKKARAGVTKTTAEAEAVKKKNAAPPAGRGLSVSEAEADEGLLNLRKMAKVLYGETNKIAPAMGWIESPVRDLDEALTGGAAQSAAKRAGLTDTSGEDWAVYRSELDQFIQNYGKVLEGGKLTDADIIRYDRALKKTKNPDTLKRIIKSIERKMDYIEQNRLIARARAGRGSLTVPSHLELTGEEWGDDAASQAAANEDPHSDLGGEWTN